MKRITKIRIDNYKAYVKEQLIELPNGKNLKVWGSLMTGKTSDAAPGTVVEVGKKSFFVACGTGVVEITEVQPESKKRMLAQVFVNGRGVQVGDVLGVQA